MRAAAVPLAVVLKPGWRGVGRSGKGEDGGGGEYVQGDGGLLFDARSS